MRIFRNFSEARSELERELAELGTIVHRKSWQGQAAGDREAVRELRNYQYTVTRPDLDELDPTQPWADAEFKERVAMSRVNPGEAWKLRPEVWEELLEVHGETSTTEEYTEFSYTYNERFDGQLEELVNLLCYDPTTRRAYLPVYQPGDLTLAQAHRVPCSLGYLFEPEGDKLHMTYYMRSCDWARHFQDDVYLALRLRGFILQEYNHRAGKVDFLSPGEFCHIIGNLHVFEKDVAHVF